MRASIQYAKRRVTVDDLWDTADDVPSQAIRLERLRRALPLDIHTLRLRFPVSYDGPKGSAEEKRLFRDLAALPARQFYGRWWHYEDVHAAQRKAV